jgi:GLPGLI family protein
MKSIRLIGMVFILLNCITSNAQKTISEGTITYDISIEPKSKDMKNGAGGLNGAKTIIYLKGGLCRTDMNSSLGTETTIYNSKIGNAVILKEYSGQKLMITLTKENWESKNKKFIGITFENTTDTKVIDGYNCIRAIAKLKDGSAITVYYTPDLTIMNKEYSQIFKNLPGFPLEYELETEKLTFKYKVDKIDFSPLPASKFDFPKSGYRVLTYDESKGSKNEE